MVVAVTAEQRGDLQGRLGRQAVGDHVVGEGAGRQAAVGQHGPAGLPRQDHGGGVAVLVHPLGPPVLAGAAVELGVPVAEEHGDVDLSGPPRTRPSRPGSLAERQASRPGREEPRSGRPAPTGHRPRRARHRRACDPAACRRTPARRVRWRPRTKRSAGWTSTGSSPTSPPPPGLHRRGTTVPAAMACVRLGEVFANLMGNPTAGRAWFTRAQRLVATSPPASSRDGWRWRRWAATSTTPRSSWPRPSSPSTGHGGSATSTSRPRRWPMPAWPTYRPAGRRGHGPPRGGDGAGLRAGRRRRRRGAVGVLVLHRVLLRHRLRAGRVLGRSATGAGADRLEPGGPVFLSSHCDRVQATLLVELGRWSEAEAVLAQAQAEFEAGMQIPAWHPDIGLAELRVRQGRLADAERCCSARTSSSRRSCRRLGSTSCGATRPRAGGRPAWMRSAGADRLRAVELLGSSSTPGSRPAISTRPAPPRGDGRARRRARRPAAARPGRRRPLRCSRPPATSTARWRCWNRRSTASTRYACPGSGPRSSCSWPGCASPPGTWPRQLGRQGRRRPARDLDVVLGPADIAVLERLAWRRSRRRAPDPCTAVLARDGGWWTASCAGRRRAAADTKGLRYLAELVANPGVERHTLDLVDRVEGVDPDGVGPPTARRRRAAARLRGPRRLPPPHRRAAGRDRRRPRRRPARGGRARQEELGPARRSSWPRRSASAAGPARPGRPPSGPG